MQNNTARDVDDWFDGIEREADEEAHRIMLERQRCALPPLEDKPSSVRGYLLAVLACTMFSVCVLDIANRWPV